MLCFKAFSQPTDFLLPEGKAEIELNYTAIVMKLYITKHQEVYFEDEKLQFYDQIASAILKAERQAPEAMIGANKMIYIYADRNVPYSFVEGIKMEIAKLGIRFLFYKTNDDDNNILQAEIFRLNVFKEYEIPRPIVTVEEADLNQEYFLMIPPLPSQLMPSYLDWLSDLELAIGSMDTGTVKNILSGLKYESFKVLPDEKIYHNEKVYDLTDGEALSQIIHEKELLLLDFDENLIYEDYIKGIQKVRELIKSESSTEETTLITIEVPIPLKNII